MTEERGPSKGCTRRAVSRSPASIKMEWRIAKTRQIANQERISSANKTGACQTLQEAVLLEWTDETLARLIATSAGTSKLCFHAGENRLVVARKSLSAFGRALRKLGYALPKGS